MKRLTILLLSTIPLLGARADGLVINELMQSNIDAVMDDLNDFPDSWVELFNNSTAKVQLGDYSIGLSANADEAWALPLQEVQAGGHILIYCDKVASGLHTNFRLESGKGGQVYLFCKGVETDKVTNLKKQPAPNIAYGRQSDGSSEWGYQLVATPNKANGGGICDHDHILGNPVFSEPGRVITSPGSRSLVLTLPEGAPEGAQIRYTTNGAEPTSSSARYTAPLVLKTTSVIRAKIFCDGWLSPPSVTQSYIFFTRELTLPVVSIATKDSYLNGSALGIFANNSANTKKNWRRPINIEFFFGEETESALNQLCETRVSGAASRGAAKKSMALYAHKRFGTKRFDYEFFPDQCPGLTDYKSLVLRNAGNDFDYLYMRDALAQRSMATHTDIDWQAWQPAIVYINGTYHGMLNIRERANENNVRTHYDGLEDIDLIENWKELKEGDWENYNRFKAFYTEKGHTMDEYEEWMDCREFINIMILNLYFNNVDFPGNNIIMWRPRTQDGRWRWIAKDADYIMGLYGQCPANYKILNWLYSPSYDYSLNWGANSSDATRLFRRLMDDADFNREFIDRCAIYMGDFLNKTGIRAIWDPMVKQIEYEYPYHRKLINQWWPNYNSELSGAQDWVNKRTDEFYKHLGDYYGLGTPIPLVIVQNHEVGDEPAISFNGVELTGRTFYGKFFKNRTITLEGAADGSKVVSGWRVQQMNASTVTTEVDGPLLTMTMPECTSLIITPQYADASGITTHQAPQWHWSWSGSDLLLNDVEAGVMVSLYDLRGMLLYEAKSTGAPLQIAADGKKMYVLKVGNETVKIAR